MALSKAHVFSSAFLLASVVEGARPAHLAAVQGATESQMSATVYGEPTSRYPKGVKQIVELLRFTTGYDYGLETLVDVTPYAPLIDALTKSTKPIEAYTFIDTWVGKNTGWKVESFLQADDKNSTHKSECREVRSGHDEFSQGNGWGVTAELVLWERPKGAADVRPRHTVTVASGPQGSSYDVGTIRYHEGTTTQDGKSVLLDTAADFASETHRELSVYRCPKGGESFLEEARQNFLWSKELYNNRQDPSGMESLIENVRSTAAQNQLRDVSILRVDRSTGHLVCALHSGMALEVGMPVFLNGPDIHSSFLQGRSELSSTGKVVKVDQDTFSVDLDCGCTLTDKTKDLVHLKVPRDPDWKKTPERLVAAFKKYANDLKQGNKSRTSRKSVSLLAVHESTDSELPAFVALSEEGTLEPLSMEGSLVPQVRSERKVEHSIRKVRKGLASGVSFLHSGSTLGSGVRVCVVDEQHTGLLLDRSFHVPEKQAGDKVLMQFVVTGHGWANTQFQCGEFCHAMYAFTFNGKPGPKVSLWRDDCPQNPWGGMQAGTWDEHRNGWCPGSVEPGVFLDVTDHVKEGTNSMELDMWVYNENKQAYERFTDVAGYNKHDTASMVVGTTFSVYPKSAVDAVRSQARPLTSAERALREGASEASRLVKDQPKGYSLLEGRQPDVRRSVDELRAHRQKVMNVGTRTPMGVMAPHALLESSSTSDDKSQSIDETVADYSGGCSSRVTKDVAANAYNFEQAAPWFCYSTQQDGDVGTGHGVHRIALFQHRNVDIDERVVTSAVNGKGLPADFEWGRAALHFRLDRPNFSGTREDGKPYPTEFDHWDRLGSLGFHLTDDGPHLSLFPAAERQKREWELDQARDAHASRTVV